MAESLPIKLELRKLGLKEKEVGVYLAGLELGPSPVQKIAELAGIARPTTYETIKHLKEKGMFVEVKERGKRFFSAQSPERILGLLKTQKREIEEKEREFIRIISALESRYSKEGIRVFKDKEGLKALEEIISFSQVPEILVVNPKKNPINCKKVCLEIKKRLGKMQIKEVESKLNGTLIIFDKVAYIPFNKQIGFLIG